MSMRRSHKIVGIRGDAYVFEAPTVPFLAVVSRVIHLQQRGLKVIGESWQATCYKFLLVSTPDHFPESVGVGKDAFITQAGIPALVPYVEPVNIQIGERI